MLRTISIQIVTSPMPPGGRRAGQEDHIDDMRVAGQRRWNSLISRESSQTMSESPVARGRLTVSTEAARLSA